MAKAKKKAAANPQETMTLIMPDGQTLTVTPFVAGAPDGCFMPPDPQWDRPVGAWTDSQLGSYIRQTIHRGDVGLLLFVCGGQTWARQVAPPDAGGA